MNVYDCRPQHAGEIWKRKSHHLFQEFVFEENSDWEIAPLSWFYRFGKASVHTKSQGLSCAIYRLQTTRRLAPSLLAKF